MYYKVTVKSTPTRIKGGARGGHWNVAECCRKEATATTTTTTHVPDGRTVDDDDDWLEYAAPR